MRTKYLFLFFIMNFFTNFVLAQGAIDENECMKEVLDEVSYIIDGCYGLKTLRSSANLRDNNKYISMDFLADYTFSELHAKKALLDIMREITLRLKRSEEFNRPLSSNLDISQMDISIRVNPKKRHRIHPAILFLDEIKENINEGSPKIRYIKATKGKIRYYSKFMPFFSLNSFSHEESIADAIKEVTGFSIKENKVSYIPPIPNKNVIYAEFIFCRAWVATKKKFGITGISSILRCKDKISMLGADFKIPYPVSKEEARASLFLCLNEILREAKLDEAIYPHLVDRFDEKNLEVVLFINNPNIQPGCPNLSRISYRDGKIRYRINDQKKQLGKKNCTMETFEEAISLIEQDKLDLSQLSKKPQK